MLPFIFGVVQPLRAQSRRGGAAQLHRCNIFLRTHFDVPAPFFKSVCIKKQKNAQRHPENLKPKTLWNSKRDQTHHSNLQTHPEANRSTHDEKKTKQGSLCVPSSGRRARFLPFFHSPHCFRAGFCKCSFHYFFLPFFHSPQRFRQR